MVLCGGQTAGDVACQVGDARSHGSSERMPVAFRADAGFAGFGIQAAKDIVTDLRGPCGFFLHKNGLHETAELDKFDVTSYSSQVVAGTMHRVTVRREGSAAEPGSPFHH